MVDYPKPNIELLEHYVHPQKTELQTFKTSQKRPTPDIIEKDKSGAYFGSKWPQKDFLTRF